MRKRIFPKRLALSTMALVIMLAVSTMMASIPIIAAHDPPWSIPTWTYIAISPNPVGVGQPVAVTFMTNCYIPTAVGAHGDRWNSLYVDITKPDGTKETVGPITSDPVGGGYILYTPEQAGTYTFIARFEGYTITGEPLHPNPDQRSGLEFIGDYFEPSKSIEAKLTVQQEQIDEWPETPLPTEYWTRPINGANRDWHQLAGNWLGGAAQTVGPTTRFAYGSGPESPHILWSRQYWDGGVMDARFGAKGYYSGLSYERYDRMESIIINGRLYYNQQTPPRYGWYCVDLYTGETLYFHNTTGPATDISGTGSFDYSGGLPVGELAFAQIYDYDSPNQHGGFPYLWSTVGEGERTTSYGQITDTWMMFDAFTGNYICSIANVSTRGTMVYGKDGSILIYNIDDGRLTCWNTSQAIWYEDTWSSNEYWMWRPDFNTTFDGNNGFSLNVPIPNVQGDILEIREGEFVIGGTAGKKNATHTIEGNIWALSLKPGEEGTLLWEITFVPPETRPDEFFPTGNRAGLAGPYVYPEYDVFVFRDKEELVWYGYSLETGEQIWGPTEKEAQQNYYSTSINVYNGMMLTYGYGGELRAYDIKTGNILWNYLAGTEGFEYVGFENAPIDPYDGGAIADGKIYVITSEHSPSSPLRRGSYLRCIDLETGTELWRILHWGSKLSIADGIIVDLNLYDNKLYAYGKGPTETTVTAEVQGNSVLIQGTVIDISAGTKQQEQAARFPKGVPAISDADQQRWMEYVYMQQSKPVDVTGVQVKLTAIDSNGNSHNIGTTTSDALGNYAIEWTPPSSGLYKVIATFEGSKSYYGSEAGTAFIMSASASVSPAPASPTPAPEPGSDMSLATYAAVTAIVIIAVIVVVAVLLKRRIK